MGCFLTLGVDVQTMSEIGIGETPLDVKCGLIYNICHGQTTDALFDVKLALTRFDVKRDADNVEKSDDPLSDDFVEKLKFRVWGNTQELHGDESME